MTLSQAMQHAYNDLSSNENTSCRKNVLGIYIVVLVLKGEGLLRACISSGEINEEHNYDRSLQSRC
jgi:hypothetical protein